MPKRGKYFENNIANEIYWQIITFANLDHGGAQAHIIPTEPAHVKCNNYCNSGCLVFS